MPSQQTRQLVPVASVFGQYRVTAHLGGGIEGQSFRVVCQQTNELRTLKVFGGTAAESVSAAQWHATRLESAAGVAGVPRAHQLLVASWNARERGCLVTDYAPGKTLKAALDSSPGGRFAPARAVRTVCAVARVVAELHARGDYHGDIHTENVVVDGRRPDHVQLIDFHPRAGTLEDLQRMDIHDTVSLLYQSIGGLRRYAAAPKYIKSLCLGMRRSLLDERYPDAEALLEALASRVR